MRFVSIFKGYDVRGIYKEQIDENIASRIGRAFATLLLKKKIASKKVYIGRDNRPSSLSLRNAFVNAVLSAGFDVIDLGVVSTSLIQFAISREKAAGACIITASHNPPQYNGFKLYCKNLPLMSADMRRVEKLSYSGKFVSTGRQQGLEMKREIEGAYIQDVLSRVKLQRKLKVVIDSGNGTCGPVARELFEKMGCRVVSIFEDIESAFLNHIADPHNPENLKWLQEEVVKQKAHLGIAFDGDGDRVGFVDEKGKAVREDDVCVLFARNELQKQKGAVIYDLRFSRALPEEVIKYKGKPFMSKAGRIAIRENLIAKKAVFGGEVSGHYFFADHFGFDDGIYAGAKMLQIVSGMEKFSTEIKAIPKYSGTPELRLKCDNQGKFKLVENVRKALRKKYGKQIITIDGVYLNLPQAFGLLRVSNTEPAITLRFEGKSRNKLKEVYGIFSKYLKVEGVILPKLR